MNPSRPATVLWAALMLAGLPALGEAPPGVLLEGPASAQALASVVDRTSPGVPDTEILFDEKGRPFVSTTHFIVVLKPRATVGQANAALKSMNAAIVGMVEGQDVLEIRLPDPQRRRTLRDVDALVAALRRLPPFKDALPFSFQNGAEAP